MGFCSTWKIKLKYLENKVEKVFICEGSMHISENTQVPPEWVSMRK